MSDLDRLLTSLPADVGYSDAAADRLVAQLAAQPSPRAAARRRIGMASMACVGAACLAGAAVGAVMEASLPREPSAAILPASSAASPASLLFTRAG
jgi:hypothetical protein